jgi:hypothetical protein
MVVSPQVFVDGASAESSHLIWQGDPMAQEEPVTGKVGKMEAEAVEARTVARITEENILNKLLVRGGVVRSVRAGGGSKAKSFEDVRVYCRLL